MIQDARLNQAITLFNTERFYECHEVLEELWREEPGPLREMYQGLLQIGVACYHHAHGNHTGAIRLLRKGLARLHPFSEKLLGLDLPRFVRESRVLLKLLEQGGADAKYPIIGTYPTVTDD